MKAGALILAVLLVLGMAIPKTLPERTVAQASAEAVIIQKPVLYIGDNPCREWGEPWVDAVQDPELFLAGREYRYVVIDTEEFQPLLELVVRTQPQAQIVIQGTADCKALAADYRATFTPSDSCAVCDILKKDRYRLWRSGF